MNRLGPWELTVEDISEPQGGHHGKGGPWSHLSGPHLTTCPLLPQWFQFVEVPGNHYIHMNQPNHVASVISSLQSRDKILASL